MSVGLTELHIRNYRCAADVHFEPGPINVLFGPNGSGKSTLLDVLWFVHDCAVRGMDFAAQERDNGLGLRWANADTDSLIEIALATADVRYTITTSMRAGTLLTRPGEQLYSVKADRAELERDLDSVEVRFPSAASFETPPHGPLREPTRLSLGRYLDFRHDPDAALLDAMMRGIRLVYTRALGSRGLRRFGSEAGPDVVLNARGDNLWTVLRNIESRRNRDDRYDTIISYMRRAFPHTFDGIVIESQGPATLYASFVEKGLREEVRASGVCDAYFQMLILLTALFSEQRDEPSILLFDEPEASLHPWALHVFSEAVKEAAEDWGRQIVVATHSPVLLSQFGPDQILAVTKSDGEMRLRWLNDMPAIADLLATYGAGSLYMAEAVAQQSPAGGAPVPQP